MRPRLLDLFCGAGGAGWGYHLAGFDVVGVDIAPQPHYPLPFHQADALTFPLHGFDVVHASPPCQGYSTMSNRRGTGAALWGGDTARLIDTMRERLAGRPHVIENVMGARPFMPDAMTLHGGMFGLRVYRPRLFEVWPDIEAPAKAPRPEDPLAIYGRCQRLTPRYVWTRADGSKQRQPTTEEAREAMGMPWADWAGLRQAVPPAYTEHLGRQLLDVLEAAA
jgi:DNA (cytosine-5)-methyltransferase 1